MAQIIADRVKETSTSTGTGAFTLAGAMTGFKTFSSVCANSDTVYYTIQGVDGSGNPTAEWEVGFGSWGVGGVLTRTTVYSSSNANTTVNFSAGDKQVWIDAPANWLTKVDASSVTDFASSGSYPQPTNATFLEVWGWGAGSGGASGRRGAAASLRTGGGGGGGGALVIRRFKVSELVFPVTVTIGAGGGGGAAVTVDNTNGNTGNQGGNSTFGSYVTAYGGGTSSGGNVTEGNGGGGGGSSSAGSFVNGGQPLVGVLNGQTQQFGGGYGSTTATSGKNSVYGGGGGGYTATSNQAAGYSMYSGGGGAGGAGIDTSNALIPTVAAGGTNNATSANTSSPINYIGAAGAAYTGGQGGSISALQTALAFQQVVFGDSKFVALSTSGFYISTSANGTTGWNVLPVTTPATFSPTNFFYDGTKWVFYSTTAIYTSTDLVTFTAATAPSISVNQIAFAGGLYVAVGSTGAIRTSTDLVTWTTRTSGTAQTLNAVTYNGSKWIAVGNFGATVTSTDAITWTLVTVSGTPNFHAVAANGATLVAQSNTTPFAHYSTDSGATWNAVATTLALTTFPGNKTIIYAGGRFVFTASSAVYTSTDGNTWALQTDGTTDNYLGIAYDGTTYVVGSNTSNSNVVITATDAVTWTARTFTDGRTAASGAGGAGGIAAGGGGGAASLNGTNSGAGAAGGNGFIRVYAW
jgi:hypothetical protein